MAISFRTRISPGWLTFFGHPMISVENHQLEQVVVVTFLLLFAALTREIALPAIEAFTLLRIYRQKGSSLCTKNSQPLFFFRALLFFLSPFFGFFTVYFSFTNISTIAVKVMKRHNICPKSLKLRSLRVSLNRPLTLPQSTLKVNCLLEVEIKTVIRCRERHKMYSRPIAQICLLYRSGKWARGALVSNAWGAGRVAPGVSIFYPV